MAIARALACQPKILLMDEPFGALDVQTKETMQQFLLELWQRTHCTILQITHDVEEVVFLAQRIYALSARPGEIEREFGIDLPGDRDYRIERQSQFQSYVAEIMDLLRGRASEELAALASIKSACRRAEGKASALSSLMGKPDGRELRFGAQASQLKRGQSPTTLGLEG